MTQVNKLNVGLYSKMKHNSHSLGKKFTHKSQTRLACPPVVAHQVVAHHSLIKRQNSNVSRDAIFGARNNTESENAERMCVLPQDQSKHAKLLRTIIAPDNPFSKMTEKDMLIFNPNYHDFLKKLKSKESMANELSRIISQPYDEVKSKMNKKKRELVLYAFARTQGKQTLPTAEKDRNFMSKKNTNSVLDKSQSALYSRAQLNMDVSV